MIGSLSVRLGRVFGDGVPWLQTCIVDGQFAFRHPRFAIALMDRTGQAKASRFREPGQRGNRQIISKETHVAGIRAPREMFAEYSIQSIRPSVRNISPNEMFQHASLTDGRAFLQTSRSFS